jgi:hypothetical protein
LIVILLILYIRGSGIIRISFPDPEEEDWKIPFVRIHHGEDLEAVKFNTEAFEISESRRLKLFVDNVIPVKLLQLYMLTSFSGGDRNVGIQD